MVHKEQYLPPRISRRHKKVLGTNIVPIELNFAPGKTHLTRERKKRKRVQDGKVSHEVKERIENCPGFPVPIHRIESSEDKKGSDRRQQCYVCGLKASWYCVLCGQYYCLSLGSKKTSGSTGRKRECYFIPIYDDSGKKVDELYFGKSCYHHHHERAIRAMIGNTMNLETNVE